jgi:general secretion pathway protein J
VRARGFTLVEVMIAVGITAVMAVMTIGALRALDRSTEIARLQDERYGAVRLALTRMSREISVAFISDNYDRSLQTRFRERPTLFVGKEDSLLFTAFAHVRLYRDAKESDQSIIEYTLDSDPDHSGEKALFRREKVRIDEEPDRGGTRSLVADRLSSIRFSYWDTKRKEWVHEWSTKSLDHADELPARVRIELELRTPDGGTEKSVTETRLEITRKPLSTT